MDAALAIVIPQIIFFALDLIVLAKLYAYREIVVSGRLFLAFATTTTLVQGLAALSYAGELGLMTMNPLSQQIICTFAISCFALISYYVYFYIQSLIHGDRPISRLSYSLYAIPVAVLLIMTVLSPWTHWVFSIDDQSLYHPGSLHWLQFVIPYIYMLLVTFVTLKLLRRSTDPHIWHIFRLYLAFVLAALVGLLLQMLVLRGGYTQIGISAGMLLMYLELYLEEIAENKRLRSIAKLHLSLEQTKEQLRLANQDALTGIGNRYIGTAAIEKRLQSHEPFTMCLLDVDGFKRINDVFGHPAGDEVLKSIATVLKQTFADGVPIRLGGDEFMIIIDCCKNRHEVDALMSELFSRITTMQVPGIDCQLPYAVSVGVVNYDGQSNASFEALYHSSDRCLYQSKRHLGCHYTFEAN